MPKLREIRLKVCGLRDNISEVVALKPDYVGFIYYEKSPRFVGRDFRPEYLANIPEDIAKVGVFVNQSREEVIKTVTKYRLDLVQLHGNETVNYCEALKEKGIKIIKVFSGNGELNASVFNEYEGVSDYFLFDTRIASYGGSGKSFDWAILEDLELKRPLFISGGVSLENVNDIEMLENVNVHAIDVNSKFEVSPGLKNIKLVKQLKEKMLCSTV